MYAAQTLRPYLTTMHPKEPPGPLDLVNVA